MEFVYSFLGNPAETNGFSINSSSPNASSGFIIDIDGVIRMLWITERRDWLGDSASVTCTNARRKPKYEMEFLRVLIGFIFPSFSIVHQRRGNIGTRKLAMDLSYYRFEQGC